MMDQKQATQMLRAAKLELDLSSIEGLLPAPLKIWISNHDTGCQVRIVASEEGQIPVTVWLGSIWYSSAYDFNDRDKILGLQPEFKEIENMIENFLENVSTLLVNAQSKKAIEQAKEEGAETAMYRASVNHYLNRLKSGK